MPTIWPCTARSRGASQTLPASGAAHDDPGVGAAVGAEELARDEAGLSDPVRGPGSLGDDPELAAGSAGPAQAAAVNVIATTAPMDVAHRRPRILTRLLLLKISVDPAV
ncbi:MAG TPA: hypothetical protein VHR16_07630 [Candidatus Limnocylindrales bacterium]|jgi:hypothetical protein|nr:hypothetical protein [Candidatus Limnocylindrales bacterium]